MCRDVKAVERASLAAAPIRTSQMLGRLPENQKTTFSLGSVDKNFFVFELKKRKRNGENKCGVGKEWSK